MVHADASSKLTSTIPEILRWAAGLGAVTAESLAERRGITVPRARARLLIAQRRGFMRRWRPLTDRPALYTVTRPGLRHAEVRDIDPCRVSAAVAAALERCYVDHWILGERELRRDEREQGCPLASAQLGSDRHGEALRHRPDLVLWPEDPGALPVAVEVELTVKAPDRLTEICRAWARSRCVAGALYLATPEVELALRRAIDRAHAHERVVAVPLDALPRGGSQRTVPSAA
jgi:hypothetical protein